MPKFLGQIIQSGGDFALIDSSDVRGGFMQVKTVQDRNKIIPDKLKTGMLVYVEEEEKIYKYRANGTWTLFKVGNDVTGVTLYSMCTYVKDIVEDEEYYKVSFEEEIFEGNDLIGFDIQEDLSGSYSKVEFVRDGIAYFNKSSNIPEKYKAVYHMGNTSNKGRQLVLILHNYNGAMVLSQFLNISIDNINTNYFFRLGRHSVNSWKIYGEDVYFKGTFIDDQGRNLSDMVSLNQTTINTGLSSIRDEFGYDNLLNNPHFISGLDCWLTANTADFFTLKGKWILTNKTILSTKRDGAFVINEDGRNLLRIVNGFITQKNENLRRVVDLDDKIVPYYVTVIFSYKAVTSGTLSVDILKEDSSVGYKEPPLATKVMKSLGANKDFGTFKASFLWNGTGDFRISYSGEIKMQALVLKVNEVKNLELKYKDIFENKDTLLQMIELHKSNLS